MCDNRICYVEGGMLWTRAIQWGWTVHSTFKLVPKQRPLRILGSIPSIGESQQNHSPTDTDGHNGVHAPHEPQHHHGPRQQHLDSSFQALPDCYIIYLFIQPLIYLCLLFKFCSLSPCLLVVWLSVVPSLKLASMSDPRLL